jgi:hypothetical protein
MDVGFPCGVGSGWIIPVQPLAFSSFKDTFLQKTGAKACNEGHHDVRRHSGIPC